MNDSVKTEHIHGIGKKVLFILGWGERLENDSVRFLINHKPTDWDLVIVEIPTEFSNFDDVLTDIKAKCWHNTDILIGFSIGAIFARYKEASRRVFISPYWRTPKHLLLFGSRKISEFLIRNLRWLNLRIVPRDFADYDIGDIDIPKNVPKFLSPKTVWQIIQAQKQMPITKKSDIFLYSMSDVVIDTSIFVGDIREKTFVGKHHPLCGKNREWVFQQIIEISNQGDEKCQLEQSQP